MSLEFVIRIWLLTMALVSCNGNFDQRTSASGNGGSDNGSDAEIATTEASSPVSITGINLYNLENADLFCDVTWSGLLAKVRCQPAIKVGQSYVTAGLQFSPDIKDLKWIIDGSRWTTKASGTCVSLKTSPKNFADAAQCVYEGLPQTARFKVDVTVTGKDGKSVSRGREFASTRAPEASLLSGSIVSSSISGLQGMTAAQLETEKPASAGALYLQSRVSEKNLGQPTVESIFSLTPSSGQIVKKELFRKEGLIAEFSSGFLPSSPPSIDEESRIFTRGGSNGSSATCAQADYALAANPAFSFLAALPTTLGDSNCHWGRPFPVRSRHNGELFHVTVNNETQRATQTTSNVNLVMTKRASGASIGEKVLLYTSGPSATSFFPGSVWGSFLIVGGVCGQVGEFQLLEAYSGKEWQITCRDLSGNLDQTYGSQGRIILPQSYEAVSVGNALRFESSGNSIFKLDGKLFIPITRFLPDGNTLRRRLPYIHVVHLEQGKVDIIPEPFGSEVNGFPKIWIGKSGEIFALVRMGSSDDPSPLDLRRYDWTGSKLELKEERRLPWQDTTNLSQFPFGIATADGQSLIRFENEGEDGGNPIAPQFTLHFISFR